MTTATAYLLAVQLALGIQGQTIRVARGSCGSGAVACVTRETDTSFIIWFVYPHYPEDVVREILRHEACHVKWDAEVVNTFGGLPLREQAWRHERVEVCQKWVRGELRKKGIS